MIQDCANLSTRSWKIDSERVNVVTEKGVLPVLSLVTQKVHRRVRKLDLEG